MAKKLSTEEILKAARAQSGKTGGATEKPLAEPEAASSQPAPSEPAQAEPPKVEQPTETPVAAKPASAPQAAKSTKDILAAARAQTAGGAGAAAAPSGAAPKSTKDILAAARAQTGAAAAAPAAGAKSTKDILAAARAQSGSGAAAPAAAKPAGEKPAVAKAAPAKPVAPAAKPAGNRPSVQEMLKAAREGRPVEEPAAATAAAKPAARAVVIPQKPAPAVKKTEVEGEPRRGFLAKLGAGLAACVSVLFGTPFRAAWTSFTAASGLWGLETARFMMPNVLVEPPSKFKVGPASDYPPAAVSTKWTAQYGVWLVHNEYKGKDIIYALLTVCTHLGCTPNWLEGERKFKCPCHGSGFYITGINFEGPAPRPLERMAIRVSEDGMLEVDKSRKFQEELGQWADPASFVPVA
jgi:cytochrome b6-f complex iron-sulfur subunit